MILQMEMALMLWIVIICASSCIIGVVLAVWVYKDAKGRDMNPILWVIIVLLLSCIGLILYLIFRKKE